MNQLTHAPIPEYSDLFSAYKFQQKTDDQEIKSRWLCGDDLGYWFSRSAWSIFAIAKFRIKILKKIKLNIWLPDYLCNSSLAPLRELNVNLIFYPILEDGNPDLVACENIVDQNAELNFSLVFYSPEIYIPLIGFGIILIGAFFIKKFFFK